ncbi:MAG: hypothetical protein PHS95_03340 [Candidatus Pacebacteria bacterium]|nr:hypothetical protein [Candidatus Paceibacterota bacterium]
MLNPPFTFFSPYGWIVVTNQISFSFLSYSYIGATLLAIAFGTFLFVKTKKLSSFYLLLLCISFAIYSLLDFALWVPLKDLSSIIFSWSIEYIFSISFFILSYWFLYSFIKEHDLPMWQKILSASTLLPTFIIIATNFNVSAVSASVDIALENEVVANYHSLLELLFILLVIIFTVVEYQKALDTVNKKKIALAGTGVTAFLSAFFFAYGIINFVIAINLWGLASTSYIYNLSPYAILGMPILLGFLGYLIAKYQAFDVRLIKSIVLIVILMILLFVGLFFA